MQNVLSSSLLSKNLKIKIYRTIVLPVVLYVCETWSLTLREERRLRVFENRVLRRVFGPKRDDVTGERRKVHELSELYSLLLRSRGVNWRRVGAANDRLEWVAGNLGATFVDPNSWIRDVDFGRDGLDLNRNRARKLGDLYSRVCGIESEIQKVMSN